MSIEAIGWALKRTNLRSSEKFVLVCLANFANESMECYPSVAALEAATSQDRKTVLANLNRLMEAGLLADTGRRVGVTKSIPVYQLQARGAENGTPLIEGVKQSRFSVEAVPFFPGSSPKNGTRKHQEPSGNHQGEAAQPTEATTSEGKHRGKVTTPPVALPECVPAAAWADYVADRRERKKPLSTRAQALALSKLVAMHAEGQDVRAVLAQSIERGWSGLFPVKQDRSAMPQQGEEEAWKRHAL